MRWRLIDRIDSFEAWAAIAGTKAVSFEEISLLKPFGRKGDFPETLVLEGCVELMRWLVGASSGFTQSCILDRVEDFRCSRANGAGQVLSVSARVERRTEEEIDARCSVRREGDEIAAGRIGASLVPLEDRYDRATVSTIWAELNGKA